LTPPEGATRGRELPWPSLLLHCKRDFKFSGISDQILGLIYNTLKKTDPEVFSFWVNNNFATQQALFDTYGLMQSLINSYQSAQVAYHYQTTT